MENLVELKDLVKYFSSLPGFFKKESGKVHAVDGVSFAIREGETLGLVGESGCGKSTLARVIAKLIAPTRGEVFFEGKNIANLDREDLKSFRRNTQMVFQDPYASLNPRMAVGRIVGEPLVVHGISRGSKALKEAIALFERVGIPKDAAYRYPHEFSGGQRQRIGIARALALKPKLIIADEPVSSLDVSIQAQVLNLLNDLQKEYKLTYLFIAHDLRVVEYISDRVVVMYLGKVMEIADSDTLYRQPRHPYTEALLSAIPEIDYEKKKKRILLEGEIPSSTHPPVGCRFHTRCIYAQVRCKTEEPPLVYEDCRFFACHFPLAGK